MANKFNPTDGGKVSKTDAEKWIKKFDDDDRKDKDKDTRSVFFGKDFLQEIINTPDIAGVSFFFSKKPNSFAGKDTLNLVLVPTKADGTLVWPGDTEKAALTGNSAYDNGVTCPPTCP
jgi:hypothetical protein